MSTFEALWSSPVLRRALVELTVVGALNGLVGVHVVLRRLPFFTMTMSHGAFGGMVVASLLGVSVVAGAWAAALVIVAATALAGSVGRVPESSAAGVVLGGSFALGALALSTQASFNRDLAAFLAGTVTGATGADVAVTVFVGLVAVAVLAGLHKELVLGAFDPAAAAAVGYRPALLDAVVLAVVAATLAVSLPAVGVVLSVALLVTPATTARLWAEGMGATMVLAAAIGAVAGGLGLFVSARLDVAASGGVIAVATALFAVSLVVAPRGRGGARRLRRSDGPHRLPR